MRSLQAFSHISPEEQARMRVCFRAVQESFAPGSPILCDGAPADRVGILLSGSARLTCMDAEGRTSILESLETGDIFGGAFSPPAPGLMYQTTAVTACEALFLDYAHLIKRCPNACAHHSQLVSNVLQLTARKAQALALHVNVLSQRTTRQKLMTYFSACRAAAGRDDFVLPMTLTALADYLSVDRSAMMRELKHMKEAGLVDFRGRDVRLLCTESA